MLDLVVGLVLELSHLSAEIPDVKLVEHYHLVVAVLAEQTLEADAAEVVLAEGFDVLSAVNFAFLLAKSEYGARVLGIAIIRVEFLMVLS